MLLEGLQRALSATRPQGTVPALPRGDHSAACVMAAREGSWLPSLPRSHWDPLREGRGAGPNQWEASSSYSVVRRLHARLGEQIPVKPRGLLSLGAPQGPRAQDAWGVPSEGEGERLHVALSNTRPRL